MKNRIIATVTIVILAMAAGVAGYAGVPNARTQAKATQGSRSGEELNREVRHELVLLPYYSLFDWLQYKVEDGVVTLMGQVVRPTLKADAERVVSRVKGVDKVINQIEVLPLSNMDEQIRMNVARAIFNFGTPLYRYGMQAVPPIHIIVKNGNVTLKGVVDSKVDSQLAEIKARGVSNVFSVANELQVAKN